jgi:acyl dehydratase
VTITKRVISCAADIKALEGQEVGVSDWILVDQERINRFADATEDHQWIHVDVERARQELPTASTIAHGYLLISLMPRLLDTFVEFRGVKRVINYGLNEVRFKNMVAAGKRVRMRAKLVSARQRAGGVQVILDNTLEIEGEAKPACTAETIVLYFFES